MEKFLGLTPYHRIVVVIYIVLIPLLVFFLPSGVHYGFALSADTWVFGIFALTLTVFFVGLASQQNLMTKPFVLLKKMAVAILYGTVFAFPEEILFRGVIQSSLHDHVSPVTAIFFSSLIFGFAHVLNGARSLRPQDWNWHFSFGVFLAGFPLGFLYWMTDSLLLPTLLHTLLVAVLQFRPFMLQKSV